MKTKNLYYHTVLKRTNVVKLTIFKFVLAICSLFRVFIEVFTRKSFGERYMLLPLNVFLAVLLAAIPYKTSYYESLWNPIFSNISWYAYLVVFVIYSFKRAREIKREPGVYDMAKFSLSAGIINEWFYNIRLTGTKPTNRIIATYYEPGTAIIIGIILALLKQNIGYLFIISGIVYGISWAGQYYLGDEFIMDTIDEMICNEELVESFVRGLPTQETRGFEVYGTAPGNSDFRRKVADAMMDDDPAVDIL
jgi:hypothetical protein